MLFEFIIILTLIGNRSSKGRFRFHKIKIGLGAHGFGGFIK